MAAIPAELFDGLQLAIDRFDGEEKAAAEIVLLQIQGLKKHLTNYRSDSELLEELHSEQEHAGALPPGDMDRIQQLSVVFARKRIAFRDAAMNLFQIGRAHV